METIGTKTLEMSFTPAAKAASLLVEIANDPSSGYAWRASQVVDAWRAAMATPEQLALVGTSDDLEVDDHGVGVSEGEGGFFIQTWTWVPCDTDDQAVEIQLTHGCILTIDSDGDWTIVPPPGLTIYSEPGEGYNLLGAAPDGSRMSRADAEREALEYLAELDA